MDSFNGPTATRRREILDFLGEARFVSELAYAGLSQISFKCKARKAYSNIKAQSKKPTKMKSEKEMKKEKKNEFRNPGSQSEPLPCVAVRELWQFPGLPKNTFSLSGITS
ncbi:hypothetical protein TNCV_2982391 [Trichonephila clavipes]|nr:hypothetical protein TNCV_2982391 [Trichonephila clavipes]